MFICLKSCIYYLGNYLGCYVVYLRVIRIKPPRSRALVRLCTNVIVFQYKSILEIFGLSCTVIFHLPENVVSESIIKSITHTSIFYDSQYTK